MQDRDGPGLALQLGIVFRQGADRLPAATDHRIIKRALVCPDQWTQRCGQGEGDQEVGGWHLPGKLAFNPLLALVVLAVGARAMAA